MKQSFAWLAGIIVTLICVIAIAGWSETGTAGERSGPGAPIQDVEALARLSDGILEGTGRLWVVTVRGAHGLERFHGGESAEAAAWMAETAQRLGKDPAYANPIWSINVQGEAAQDVNGIWRHIEQAGRAERVESYEQPGTYSYSYKSPLFQSKVKSGDADIHLQAAAHQDTETKRWRVTIGTPAILIEY
jgi:hypothetical protein